MIVLILGNLYADVTAGDAADKYDSLHTAHAELLKYLTKIIFALNDIGQQLNTIIFLGYRKSFPITQVLLVFYESS